ncbi:LAQU0S04e06634g1_1 [Lachancea quebecensis]|uniref:LAQU0S04e06634g1_1 n=1 Tax=Lachancea quebecensis TaxID=1654605 RepID=A0A0P1KZP1_9SACH|nr:LAQU0S04e06634g1_1 [Lachancea quebecensis]
MIHRSWVRTIRPMLNPAAPWTRPRFIRLNSTSVLDSCVRPSKVLNAKPNLSIGITQRAASRLGQIFKESKEALRVSVESGGCHGFQYNLKLIPGDEIQLGDTMNSEKGSAVKPSHNAFEEEDDDFGVDEDIVFVLPGDGGQVVIDEKSLKVLDKTILTYTTELIGSTFKITGGNMKNSCGCGSSFDVEL